MLRLKDGKEYPVGREYVKQMQTLYQAVDVMRELRAVKARASSARRAENLYIFGKSRTALTRIVPY